MSELARGPLPSHWGRALILALAAYFVLQVIVRVVYASALGLDEAELMVTTQAWAAGYGAQPPLYSWLQRLVFDLLGPGIPALAILKNLLLFLTCVFMYGAGRMVLGRDRDAALATLALFTVPQFAWESQRSLSHTVVVVAIAAAAVYVFLLLLRDGRLWAYLAFGLCIALGMLSKYNFVILPLSLMVAAASLPALRPRILGWRMPAAIAVALVLLAPHLVWLATHLSLGLAHVEKFDMATGGSVLPAWGEGLAAAVIAAASYGGLTVAAFLAAAFVPARARLPGAPPAGGRPSGDVFARLVFRTLLIAGVLIVLAVLASRTRHLPDRWLHPVFFLLPLALFAALERRLSGSRGRILAWISAAIAVACPLGLMAFHVFPDYFGRAPHENAPFAVIAAEIAAKGLDHDYIVADGTYIAGNLKYRLPEATVAEPEYGLWPPVAGRAPSRFLLVWKGGSAEPPAKLVSFLHELCRPAGQSLPELALLPGVPITARYARMRSTDFTVNVAAIPACNGLEMAR